MARLTVEKLGGIWAAVPLVWDARMRLDEKRYRELLSRIAHTGMHGICVTGSTGESAALDDDEFAAIVGIADEACGRLNRPLQIGCGTESTAKTMSRIACAASKKNVGAVHIYLPQDVESNNRGMSGFFKAIHREFPKLPLVYCNLPKAGYLLTGEDILRIRDVAPMLSCVICIESGSYFDRLQHTVLILPDITCLISETLLVPAMLTGAQGSYGSLVMTSPRFVLGMYEHALKGRWDEAAHMQMLLVRFTGDMMALARKEGEDTAGPVIDKAVMAASGFLKGPHHTRPPYTGWRKSSVTKLRQLIRKSYPQLLYKGEGD